jgi:CRISPR-associated protein Cas1
VEQVKELKAILHSKRANIYYLQKCRVMQKDGRVLYLTQAQDEYQYWNIPIANTTCLLLGTGTSITQSAVRMLASAGVLIGFTGGGATPLFMGAEIEWMTPQSEYRPTEYLQGWMGFWFDEAKRLVVAKHFQQQRLDYLQRIWLTDRELMAAGFVVGQEELDALVDSQRHAIEQATSTQALLTAEALASKKLYRLSAQICGYRGFKRNHEGGDPANDFLNHGNYLAYGLAATTLWALGIPHAFAVMHGKTRRGALVFDVADLVKDALVLPWSFALGQQGVSEQEFRQHCIHNFVRHRALDWMFDCVKRASEFSKQLPLA